MTSPAPDPTLAALELLLLSDFIPFTQLWRLRGLSKGFKDAVERTLLAKLGPDGPWFLVFCAESNEDNETRTEKVYMKAVNLDSNVFTFQPVELLDGATGRFPSELTTLPVYTLHTDRIFWSCSLERLGLTAKDREGKVRFASSGPGQRMQPVVVDAIPLRNMSFHKPLVFENDGASTQNSDFWVAEDGGQWMCKKVSRERPEVGRRACLQARLTDRGANEAVSEGHIAFRSAA
jgi:hypothetical protein